jgi:signal peptidase
VASDVLRLLAVGYLSAVASLLFWAHAPSLLGWTPRVVLSGSMLPAISPGDVAVVAPATPGPATLPVGHVVLVTDPSRSSGFYLHRLVRYDAGGSLVTRGDANAVDDWPAVPPSKVSGQLRLVVPAVGLPMIWWREHDWALLGGAGALTWGALVLASGLLRGGSAHRRTRESSV